MAETEQYSEAFALVAELAIQLGAQPLTKHNQCWERRVDEQWQIAVNGHEDERKGLGAKVPGFHCYVVFNGWPAGFITPFGGTMVAGAAANEGSFIEALKGAIARVGS